MIQLYFAPGACSFVPHALLEDSGLAFEPTMVKLHKGEQNAETFRGINPRGQVPVLVQDGIALTQIVALCLHIDALCPEREFLPRDAMARSQAISTLAWMNNTVHPTFTHVFMPQKYHPDAGVQEQIRTQAVQQYGLLLDELQQLAQNAQAQAPAGASEAVKSSRDKVKADREKLKADRAAAESSDAAAGQERP